MPPSAGPEPSIHIAVTAHPDRAADAERLRDLLSYEDARSVFDPDPNGPPSGIRSAAAAWTSIPAGATHQVVVQDDASPCEGFADALDRAVRRRPDDPICLYTPWGGLVGHALRIAAMTGRSWFELPGPTVPAVALALPRALGLRLGAFLAERASRPDGRDSTAMWDFFAQHDIRPLGVVPNLVDHDRRGVRGMWTRRASVMANSTDVKSGLRRSACFGRDVDGVAPPNAEVATLTAHMPHPAFGGTTALVSSRGEDSSEWTETATLDWLSARKWTFRDLVGRFDAVPVHHDVEAVLGRPVLFQLWLTAFATGLLHGPDLSADLDDDPVARVAAGTLAPGVLRRVLAPPALEALQETTPGFVLSTVRDGAEARER